jgi:hypothetical protein
MLIGARGFQASIQAFSGESQKKLVQCFIAYLVGERTAYHLFRSRTYSLIKQFFVASY